MEIKKGTKLIIYSSRKGTFKATALKDFNTERGLCTVEVDEE